MDASAESKDGGEKPSGESGGKAPRSRDSDAGGKPSRRDEKPREPARRRSRETRPERDPSGPGPARLYALLAGAFLALLGVLGFFYDASFGTGDSLASDDLAGILMVNGWRNVIYIVTGVLALALAARRPRLTAFGLGLVYFVFAIWGFDQTERGIGDLLDTVPLGDRDNVLHLILGVLGLGAALVDGPLPKLPERVRPKRRKEPKRLKASPKTGSGEEPGSKPKPGRTAKPEADSGADAGADKPKQPAKKRDLPRPRPAGSPRPSSSS